MAAENTIEWAPLSACVLPSGLCASGSCFFFSLFRFDGGARSLRACLPSCHCCPPRKERRFPGYCFKRLISFFLPPLLGLSYTRDGAALPMSLNYSGLSPSGSKPTLTRSLPCTPRAFRARVGCERKKKEEGGEEETKSDSTEKVSRRKFNLRNEIGSNSVSSQRKRVLMRQRVPLPACLLPCLPPLSWVGDAFVAECSGKSSRSRMTGG